MKSKIRLLLSFALLALLTCQVRADDPPPYHLSQPPYVPPAPPAPGQPGSGPGNTLSNGVYYDYTTGFWVIPDGLWQGNFALRSVYFPELYPPEPPSRPSWAIFDMEPNGTYYYGGGYYNGNYYAEGFYLPEEIH